MLFKRASATLRHALLGATSLTFALTAATAASARTAGEETPERPTSSEESPGIVIRNDLNPNALPPAGVLDEGINGVGQMSVRPNPATTGLSLCTGTLINPRTVIFAAHCVNTRPAEAYGKNGTPFGAHTTGGTPIAFGFDADNRPAVRQWLGLDGGTAGATNIAKALYAVEQVWYDPRSLTTPGSNGFIVADVAIATLDTPAFDIPTWAMLFSPLDGPTHATITGYGNAGRENQSAAGTPGGIAIDFRRRAAENMISVLGSFNDRNQAIFGSTSVLQNNLYMTSFNDPDPAYNPAAGKFDFGIFGGAALPREGTTAGGDSGGPLIVDQKYDRSVVAGVLSGGSRFFGAQQFHNYGTHSFYQPLHLYWDLIVANNSYVYAGNKAGEGDWEDGSHWVQLMDPNYMIDVDGKLVNGLPDTAAQGIAPGGAKFGQICFLNDCTTLTGTQAAGNGTAVFVPGGPGSTDFVPNNVSANPAAGVRARYYDVTLSAAGTTNLGSSVTIDRMTLDGRTRLNVKNGGSLSVLGEYNQLQGWTNVDGRIQSGRDMLVLSGMLSGSGTVKAPFVTVVAGIVAPGGADTIGTLTVNGNMIMSSGAALFVDANRFGADQLAVTGLLNINGSALVMNKAKGAAPRHGDSFVIATAGERLTGAFGPVFAFQGVLRPELTYTANDAIATLRAGSLANQLGQSGPTERAFAQALDTLRAGSYLQLYNLFGNVDLMDATQLSVTLRGLAPAGAVESFNMQDRQSRMMRSTVSDRLSMLGRDASGRGLAVIGAPQAVAMLASAGRDGNVAAPQMGLMQGIGTSSSSLGSLPEGVSGFVAGGVTANRSALANVDDNGGQRFVHMAMGLEFEVSDGLTIGSAVGHVSGSSEAGRQDRSDNRMSQVAMYGSWRMGGGAYLAGLAAAETSRADIHRTAGSGDTLFNLTGASSSERFSVMAETGVNLPVGRGLEVTPKASLGWSTNKIGGFQERGGELALAIDDISLERVEARLGVQTGGAVRLANGWSLRPQMQAEAVHLLSGASHGMMVRFAAASDLAFALPLAGGDSNWGEVKGGLHVTNGSVSVGANLESTVGRSDFRDSRAVGEMSVRF